MAVLMRTELQGVTLEQVQPLIEQVIGPMKTFPGFIFHARGPIPGGVQVTEVWETQEAHERWVREVIAPTMRRSGMSEVPPSQYLPVEGFLTR
jgi:hypothetical protein